MADTAEARKVTIRQVDAPEVTITVPAGWKVQERRTRALLTNGPHRVVVRQCRLVRFMPEKLTLTTLGDAAKRAVVVRIPGGSCLGVDGTTRRFAERLRPVLGTGGRAPRSDFEAEQLARSARERTLAQPRIVGTASAHPFGYDRFVSSTFEYDAEYSRQVQQYPWSTVELVRDRDGDHVRELGAQCWGLTSTPTDDDALEPRLELTDWDAPPSTKTSWHVSYKPIVTLPDRTRVIRWTGFVADGEAIVGTDGLLQRVRIDDHHMARGRSSWQRVEVAFTGFPAAIPHVSPQPPC